jgi:energy-coupling factor transporter ATP-binding protein EcfA2
MSEATIEVSGLRKRFGPTLALDGMTFTVRPGQVTGFVGPNGAGKSTTMRVILGLDAADEGSALIGGQPYQAAHPARPRLRRRARLPAPVTGRRAGAPVGRWHGSVPRPDRLLSLGVATAVRDSAAAIGIVLGLLYLIPIIAAVVNVPDWHRHLEQIAPMTAGLAIQATTGLRSLPITPWAGLGVLAAWAAAALLTGGLLLRLRDA